MTTTVSFQEIACKSRKPLFELMDEAQKLYDSGNYQDAAIAFKHAALAYRRNWGELQEAALVEIGRSAFEEQLFLCPYIDSGYNLDSLLAACPKVLKVG